MVLIGSQPRINRTFSPANQFTQISRCNVVIRFISGAQVTVINKDCFKEYMRGKPCRPARLKGVAEDNSLMAEVVDEVEIEFGYLKEESSFCG